MDFTEKVAADNEQAPNEGIEEIAVVEREDHNEDEGKSSKEKKATVVGPVPGDPMFCGECVVPPIEKIIIPADVVKISPTDESVYVVGTREGKVTRIAGLDKCQNHLQTLILRSCLLSSMNGISSLTLLTKLELYDNHIEEIDHLENLVNLRILDLSFNAIRTMENVAHCPLLEELYVAQNKLRKIEGIETLKQLRILDLGANRIRVIEGLENNTALKSLWLGKNKIEEITGLENCTAIRQLDIQNNRLTCLGDGLKSLMNLEELYLACNAIENVEGLPVWNLGVEDDVKIGNDKLNTIDLSTNKLSSIEGIEQMTGLEECWLTSSLIDTFDKLTSLKQLPNLTCVYLEHSPIAKDFEYRKTLTAMIPTLTQLDATMTNKR